MNSKQFLVNFSERETEVFKKKLSDKIKSATDLINQVDNWWSDNVKALVIRGETPEWNDGEECFHGDHYSIFYHDGTSTDGAEFLYRIDEDYYCFLEKEDEKAEAAKALQNLKDEYGDSLVRIMLEASYETEEKTYEKKIYGEATIRSWERPVIGTETVSYKFNKFTKPTIGLSFETNLAQQAFDTNYLIIFTRENGELAVELRNISPRW